MATAQEELDAELEAARQQVDSQAEEVAAVALAAMVDGSTRGGGSGQFMMVWPAALEKAVASLSRLTALAAVLAVLPRKDIDSGESLSSSRQKPDQLSAGSPDEVLDKILPDTTAIIRKIVQQDVIEPARQRQLREMSGRDKPMTTAESRRWAELIGRTAATRAASEVAMAMAAPVQDLLETQLSKVWLSRGDSRVRSLHRQLHAKSKKMGEPFWQELGTGRSLSYPGDPNAPIEQTINCRCHMFLARSDEAREAERVFAMDDADFALAASAARSDALSMAAGDLEAARRAAALTASGGGFSGIVIVALPDDLDEIEYKDGDKTQAHCTLAYLGKTDDADDDELASVMLTARRLAETYGPFTAEFAGKATLGEDQEEVQLIEADELQDMRETIMSDSCCSRMHDRLEKRHPHYIPHITYPHDKDIGVVKFTRIGVWMGERREELDLT